MGAEGSNREVLRAMIDQIAPRKDVKPGWSQARLA